MIFMKQTAAIKDNRGLTLIELIVAVGLFAILTLAITRVYLRVIDVQQRINQEQNLEGDLKYAMNVLTDETSKAKIHTADCGSCTGCAGKYFCSDGAGRLCMLDANSNCVEYFLDANKQIIVKRGGGTEYVITSKDIAVQTLNFEIGSRGDYFKILANIRSTEYPSQSLVYQTLIAQDYNIQ